MLLMAQPPQRDPVGDSRCHGCGRGSNWHKSARLCFYTFPHGLFAKCAGVRRLSQTVTVCRMLDKPGAKTAMRSRLLEEVARGYLAVVKQDGRSTRTLRVPPCGHKRACRYGDAMTEMQQPRTQSLSWRSPAQSTAAADMPTVTADDSDGRIHPPQRPGRCNRLGSLHLVFPTVGGPGPGP